MTFLTKKKKFLEQMKIENKDDNFKEVVEKAKHISFVIHIKEGEINVQTSGPPLEYLIVNEDSQSIVTKKIRDPFMQIPYIIKAYIEKWQNSPKKKT